MNFDHEDKERDLSLNRIITLDNGTKMFIRKDDQYGFWKIHNEKGKVAEEINGNYTNPQEALLALKRYTDYKIKKPIVSVQRGYGIVTDVEGKVLTT